MKRNKEKQKNTSIGGQAVIEGIMMRGSSSIATAVRDEDGIIRVESKRIKPTNKKKLFFRLPIVRGICAFIDSLVGGTRILMRSAEVYGEEEPTKFEKWLAKKFKIDIMSVVITFSLLLGFALAVALFVIAPIYFRKLIEYLVYKDASIFAFSVKTSELNIWLKNLIEGGSKIIIFVGYIAFCCCIKDVKRTFMYHGAEHKTITCFESGLDLTIENARKCKRVHDRCGTTFIVFVMIISIIVFSCFEAIISSLGVQVEGIIRIACKIALLPLVAGLSYELLKALAKTKSPVFFPLKVPGLLLQKLTTKEPDDKMLEVAIKAFTTVYEMDNDSSIKEQKFITAKKSSELVESIYKELCDSDITEKAEAEWIVSLIANIKRDEVYADKLIKPVFIEKINKIVEERCSGRPLWYCIGDTNFYGYKIKVDERVLIPRPETELLVLEAKKHINSDSKVLDLCTGSGAIAIALSKECVIQTYASDISSEALNLAKENAQLNGANVVFIESDLFENIEQKFDVIVSNPPYIKSNDIDDLQKEVREFEPIIALDGGIDGLDFYKRIAKESVLRLNKGGVLLLEVGIEQAKEVKDLLKEFSKVEIIKDLENIERIIKAVF